MLKKLYWKFTAIFLALAVAAVMITGSFIAAGTVNQYKTQFVTAMTTVSQSSLPQTIQSILASQDADDIKAVQLEEALLRFGGSMGTNENRTCFVLNAKDAGVIVPASLRPGSLSLTPNLSAAMRAAKGDQISITADYSSRWMWTGSQTT